MIKKRTTLYAGKKPEEYRRNQDTAPKAQFHIFSKMLSTS